MQTSNDISFYIQQKLIWSQLPTNIRSKLGNDLSEYNKAILNYSLQNQLRFKTSLIHKVFKNEKKYYEKLLNYSRDKMLLYPYHLQDIVVTGLRTTSFMYYIDMLCQIMSEEKSYDFIPNFTAADCLRLLGIGRNQYIDLMNNLRSLYSSSNSLGTTSSVVNVGRRFLGLSTANPRKDILEKIRSILPQSPMESVVIEPWWIVNVGVVLEPDIAICSQSQKNLIDFIIDKGQILAGTIDADELKYLYRQGMVYMDVPIEATSIISVPTLEGFVMNRTTGDYLETLLYKIFVAIDEHSTVEGLSQILQIPLPHVQQAISVFCRLQFANKKSGNSIPINSQHPSWNGFTSPSLRNPENSTSGHVDKSLMETFLLDVTEEDNFNGDIAQCSSGITCTPSMFFSPSPSTDAVDMIAKSSPHNDESNSLSVPVQPKKLAFIFDSSLTAYLMMGNLSVGLKNHAVTMFEVGKLSEECLDSFLAELDEISDVGEGEAQRYYEHAVNLRQTIRRLRQMAQGHGLDLLRCGSLFSLDCGSRTRMLTRNYKCLISMAPINYHGSCDNNGPGNDDSSYSRSELALSTNPELPHFGPVIPEVTSFWFKLYVYTVTGSGPPTLLLTNGYRLRRLPSQFHRFTKLLLTPWQQESVVVSINCALVTINDALTHSPLLVQGYDTDGQIIEKHVVFPLEANQYKHGKELTRLLGALDEHIDLVNKCGYISYLETVGMADKHRSDNQNSIKNISANQDSTKNILANHDSNTNITTDNSSLGSKELKEDIASNNKNSETHKIKGGLIKKIVTKNEHIDAINKADENCPSKTDLNKIMVLNLHFGVPLFESDLNKLVLDQLSTMKLFSQDVSIGTDRSRDSMRTLAIRLLEFIDQHGGSSGSTPVDQNSPMKSGSGQDRANRNFGDIPLPTNQLFFHDGALEYFS